MVGEIQNTVYEIIRFSRYAGLRHITKKQIKEETLKTPIGKYNKEIFHYHIKKNKKITKLDCMIDQALYQLSKYGKILKKGKGRYQIAPPKVYQCPIKVEEICSHVVIEPELGKATCTVTNKVFKNVNDLYNNCITSYKLNEDTRWDCIIASCPGHTLEESNTYTKGKAKNLINHKERREERKMVINYNED